LNLEQVRAYVCSNDLKLYHTLALVAKQVRYDIDQTAFGD
jgi:hypothetical protein